jgi:hypothetical protein
MFKIAVSSECSKRKKYLGSEFGVRGVRTSKIYVKMADQ